MDWIGLRCLHDKAGTFSANKCLCYYGAMFLKAFTTPQNTQDKLARGSDRYLRALQMLLKVLAN